jgi:hypothetical protein
MTDHKPMHPPTLEEDFKAMERGLAFFSALKEAEDKKPSGMVQMTQEEYDTLMTFKENHMRLFKNWVDSIRVPLTEEQIAELFGVMNGTLNLNTNIYKLIDAVRKVEKAHGIV